MLVIVCGFLCSSCSFLKGEKEEEAPSYSVSNDYFTYLSFTPSTNTISDAENNKDTYEYVITINSECSVSIYEFTATVRLYSNGHSLLYRETIIKSQNVAANTAFSFSLKVTQKVQTSTASAEVAYEGKSYEVPKNLPATYSITFVYNNNSQNKTVKVRGGKTVGEPASPTKKNYIFLCWCTNKELTKKYDFSQAVNNDFSLYAKYIVDYALLTNTITTTTMKANVTVRAKSYNGPSEDTNDGVISKGSGIIFGLNSSGNYFLLTNNHVAVTESGYAHVSYTIEDYLGNTYTGYLKYKDAKYDLAVLYFKKGITLAKVDFATENPSVNEELVSLGQPLGQTNAISYGKCTSYDKLKLNNEKYLSDVTFDVIYHSCSTDNGSSGGAILNTDLKLVGIHYAGTSKTSGEFIRGYAIPIEKVNEFLDLSFYNS